MAERKKDFFWLALMDVHALGSSHSSPSAQGPIDTGRQILPHMGGGGGAGQNFWYELKPMQNFEPYNNLF